MAQDNNDKQMERMQACAGTYLTFGLGNEFYGIPILKVQEIIGMQEVTKVPRMPSYVKGVINLRGRVIPVVDLRLKFGMQSREVDRNTCIIILYVQRADTEITMGVVVDHVSEVMNFTGDSVEPPPEFGVHLDTAFILGLGKQQLEDDDDKNKEMVVMLLDVDRILTAEELQKVVAS